MPKKPLLLEIGVEELPSSYVDAALKALPELVTNKLTGLRLGHGAIHAYGTPRRLAVLVEDLDDAQPDLDEEVLGPPESAAYKDGKPTKAAEAFATKLGVAVEALTVVAKEASGKQKAGRYVVGRRKEKGRPARELLGVALAEVCGAIAFRKSMRWGSGEATFGRPVQWLVVLFGADVVDASFAGVRSGRATRGHRFLAPAVFDLPSADTYVARLREAHVLVDRDERARRMMERVAAAAKAAGGVHDPDPYLVDENASLVEEPHVVTGSFDPAYLALPAAVIRAVARGHQKYFCVLKSEDELLPHYLTVVNTANEPKNVAKGNDRVMRARLADGRFFFEEDKKVDAEKRIEKLAGLVFQNRLGSVKEKTERLEKHAKALAARVGQGLAPAEQANLARRATSAAHLAKNDLVSLMVGEFPELQGQMGRAYALAAGVEPEIADAIRDHYKPVGAQDDVPSTDVATLVALADRFDTLVGCFAIGLSPTGAADPYALRRACIAALNLLVRSAPRNPAYAKLCFSDIVRLAYQGYAGKKLDLDEAATVQKVEEFASERLRGLIAAETSAAAAEAVLAGRTLQNGASHPAVDFPAYAFDKARALHAALASGASWIETARGVSKRLLGIGKSAAPDRDAWLALEKAGEKNAEIFAVIGVIEAATENLDGEAAIRAALERMEDVAKRLETIFVNVLVNDPADPVTPKRLAALSYAHDRMRLIADFSRLS